jgi:hypothetical protein
MSEQPPRPLIGPLQQRGWREVLRLRPIGNASHVALVITRQGRQAGIIPADDRRVLSDYITWPYEFREVDTRERLMPIVLRLDSCDAGYEFDASFKLIYQVERPERVALELENALAELEQALVQSIRATSRSFGVEQVKALEHNLLEALLYGDVLRKRLSTLGLMLRHADVTIQLDERARERAEIMRDHMRERPLMVRLAVESLDSATSFVALLGGSYRLTSRLPTAGVAEAGEAQLQEIILRTLTRVAITFAPHDYEAAERAMADALRHDSLLQAELATAEIELLRTTVKIQPDRDMVLAAQQATPALPAPEPSVGAYYTPPLLPAAQTDAYQPPETPMPWGAFGQMFGREQEQPMPQDSFLPSENWSAQVPVEIDRGEQAFRSALDSAPEDAIAPRVFGDAAGAELSVPDLDSSSEGAGNEAEAKEAGMPDNLPDAAPAEPASPGEGVQGSPDQEAISWGWLGSAYSRSRPADTTSRSQASPDEPAAYTPDLSFVPAPEAPSNEPVEVDPTRVARWLNLLKADDPALFKLWSLELQGQPEALPTILSALTNDPNVLRMADDPLHQHALVLALQQPAALPQQPEEAPPPAASSAVPPAPPPPAVPEESEPPPDWLRLRRSWRDNG